MNTVKYCSVCLQFKDISCFSKFKRDINNFVCKSCKKKISDKRCYERNKHKQKELKRIWREKNREEINRKAREWRKNNPLGAINNLAKRRSAKLNATPVWANDFYIKEIYRLALDRTKLTGIKWEVDHIIPLKNELVCGLHVEFNLQVITRRANRKKGNNFIIT